MYVKNSNQNGFSVKAWQGDAKTLLGFNFSDTAAVKAADAIVNLAGFSIQVQPHGKPAYYLLNSLTLPPGNNAVDATDKNPNSSINAPFQKFRWLHVPGSFHQGDDVYYGVYTYTITPRYFDNNGLLTEFNAALSVAVDVQVVPFVTGQVELGFTRGFTQSQAFAHHFGTKGAFKPSNKELLFDTTAQAGENIAGQSFTYQQEFEWSGYTARQKIFAILNAVNADATMSLDVFAYDLDEPDVMKIFLNLAKEGRIRMILDNDPKLHHNPTAPEDAFQKQYTAVAKEPDSLTRGRFKRYAHDKVFIVYQNGKAIKVLSGSTNFSVSGMYINSNHVIIFNNPDVAALYAKVFNEALACNVSVSFNQSPLAEAPFAFNQVGLPDMSITFSPHQEAFTLQILNAMATRISASSSVLFAVMGIATGEGPIYPLLNKLHEQQQIFSYGISDAPTKTEITLYKPGSPQGELVTAKPGTYILPPPFDKEFSIGVYHQIHHKFVICDFNTPDAVMWCGSSNLAQLGEEQNGDNLIQIKNADIATVFAIEALALVDHFDFRDAHASGKPSPALAPKAPVGKTTPTPVIAPGAATKNEMHLYNNTTWAQRYYEKGDLHYTDRELFG